MRATRGYGTGLLLVIALVVAGCAGPTGNKAGGAGQSVLTLTLANASADDSTVLPFADAARSLSSGALTIDIKNEWRGNDLQADGELIKDVEADKADLGVIATRSFDTVGIDGFEALQAPFLIDTYAFQAKVLASSIPKQMLESLGAAGLVGLAVVPGPMRRLLGLSRALVTVADLRGATIGIRPSHVTERTVEALGATPVAFQPGGEVPISTLDGIESHLSAIAGNGYDAGAVALTANVNLWPRPSAIFANAKVFAGLTAEQQGWLRTAAATAAAGETPAVLDQESGDGIVLCRRNLRFVLATAADLVALRQAAEPVYSDLNSNAATRAFIDQIAAMRVASDATPDAAPCLSAESSPGPSPSSAPVTPLDGTWEVTLTEAELLAASPPPVAGEDIPGNYGHFTLDLHAGQFVITGPLDVSRGSFTVVGNEITFSNPTNGETFTATWSIYRDTLTFGVGLPTGYRVKPWHKVSD